ncbi:MAG: hypothetical protein ABI357_05840 [Granulicella sp.]
MTTTPELKHKHDDALEGPDFLFIVIAFCTTILLFLITSYFFVGYAGAHLVP